METVNEIGTDRLDSNQTVVSRNESRIMKSNPKIKRSHRKRNREGQLLNGTNAGTSHSASRNRQIEVIDVEQFIEKPLVDLTEDSGNFSLVDLTHSPDMVPHRHSVILWNMSPRTRNNVESERTAPVEENPLDNTLFTCAICMDDYEQIKKEKRQLMSTTCGHVFCNPCIVSSVQSQAKCPTCRKKITKKSLHPIFL